MKNLLANAGLGAIGLCVVFPASAGSVSASLTASVTLNSKCRVKSGSDSQTLTFAPYDAFSVSDVASSNNVNIDFECTRDFSAVPNVEFDAGTDKTSSAPGSTATGVGVAGGLQYAISVAAGVKTAGTAATTSTIGTPDTYRYVVSGSIPSGQAGNSALPTTQDRVLTITY